MNINLCTIDWVAISAIITAIMAIIAGLSLIQARKQSKKNDERWHNQYKGTLTIRPIIYKQSFYCIELRNIGLSFIEDLSFSLEESFIELFTIEKHKEYLRSLSSKHLMLQPNESFKYYLSPTSDAHSSHSIFNVPITNAEIESTIAAIESREVIIKGHYTTLNQQYFLNQTINISDSRTSALVENNKIEESLMDIAKSAKKIAEKTK